jgi:non-heme chloroperoxidase
MAGPGRRGNPVPAGEGVQQCRGASTVEVAAPAALVGFGPELALKLHEAPDLRAVDAEVGLDLGGQLADGGQDLSAPFYGANRPGAQVSQGVRDSFWLWSMQVGLKGAYDCVKAFSETDLTEDLKRIDVPTLIIHGDDDQIVPIDASARRSVELVKDATLKVYPGAPHGLFATHKDQFNADLLAFLRT